jgi:hypothetical protein
VLKDVYDHSDSDSNTDENCKQLHIMYGGSWDVTSRRVVKTLRRAVAAAAPAPRAAPHHKWMETSIDFDASDCPKNMTVAGQLSLVVFAPIANVRLYHTPIDGEAAVNLISLVAFQKLRIPMSRLTPLHLILGMGPDSIILHGSISLWVMSGMPENYHTESIIFNVVEVNLPFNAIIGMPSLYQFMAVAHYDYMVLKMSSPNVIIKICGDRTIGTFMLEKLQALAVA